MRLWEGKLFWISCCASSSTSRLHFLTTGKANEKRIKGTEVLDNVESVRNCLRPTIVIPYAGTDSGFR